jgi:hypothetical protein
MLQKRHVNNHSSMKCNIIQTNEGFVGNENSFVRNKNESSYNNTIITPRTESIISGIDVSNEERYRSSHQRQMQFEPTSKNQMVLTKRTGPRKSINDPAQAGSQIINPFDSDSYHEYTSKIDQSKSFQSRTSSVNFGKSFISNIGNSLVNEIPQRQQPSVDNRMLSKDLISQNYNAAPGHLLISS